MNVINLINFNLLACASSHFYFSAYKTINLFDFLIIKILITLYYENYAKFENFFKINNSNVIFYAVQIVKREWKIGI